MNRREKHSASDRFRRDLFAAREIAETRPGRIVNWVAVRRLTAIAVSCWALSVLAVVLDAGQHSHIDSMCFALGLPFAFAAIAFRLLPRLWIDRQNP